MEEKKVVARVARGFRDMTAGELKARETMIAKISSVYQLYGFEPLMTPSMEYVDCLGKNLPEQSTPMAGIFALQDDDGEWISLRYDQTAPLARYVAQNKQNLPAIYRRYAIGPVWRMEKPGPGRFREFYQCDFDTVGSASPAADAEVCTILAHCFRELGLGNDFLISVSNRKILSGILEAIGVPEDDGSGRHLTILRAIDKLDRLGIPGVKLLLGAGRRDESGDFTAGANLTAEQIEQICNFLSCGSEDRQTVCNSLANLVGSSTIGLEGVEELRQMDKLLTNAGLDGKVVRFDPGIVRGLAYYTGIVYEATLTFEITDEKGEKRQFGAVAGGGRYDGLLTRFTKETVPATGASIGIDRLLSALQAKGLSSAEQPAGPVLVTVMDKESLPEYQKMVAELRAAGIRSELYLGTSGFRAQMKYADKRRCPAIVVAGTDEFAANTVSVKDMYLGTELAANISSREEWREQPAQVTVSRDNMVTHIKEVLARYGI